MVSQRYQKFKANPEQYQKQLERERQYQAKLKAEGKERYQKKLERDRQYQAKKESRRQRKTGAFSGVVPRRTPASPKKGRNPVGRLSNKEHVSEDTSVSSKEPGVPTMTTTDALLPPTMKIPMLTEAPEYHRSIRFNVKIKKRRLPKEETMTFDLLEEEYEMMAIDRKCPRCPGHDAFIQSGKFPPCPRNTDPNKGPYLCMICFRLMFLRHVVIGCKCPTGKLVQG